MPAEEPRPVPQTPRRRTSLMLDQSITWAPSPLTPIILRGSGQLPDLQGGRHRVVEAGAERVEARAIAPPRVAVVGEQRADHLVLHVDPERAAGPAEVADRAALPPPEARPDRRPLGARRVPAERARRPGHRAVA